MPDTASTPFLEADGLVKRYGGTLALDHASFRAAAGEVHALLGENGAGKSTFIKVLTGAVSGDEGVLRLGGREIPIRGRGSRDAGIAAVFQELSLIPDLTVAQNIWFRREPRTPLRTIPVRDLVRRTEALFERYGFPQVDPGREVRGLSVAERQLVELAKALASEPNVLVLDEATSALAPQEAAWLLGLVRRLASEGALVIFISHRMAEVRQVADRLTVFRNGATVGTGTVGELDDDEIVTMMLGRRLERLYPEREATVREALLLEARDLRLGHRLRGVDLALREGEILGIGGLQGQGQLELFLSLVGAVRARGEILVSGRRQRIRNPRDALRAGIGVALVPEDRQGQGLLLDKSVRENVSLGVIGRLSRFGLLDLREERARVGEALRSLHVVLADLEQPVDDLSGGNQQKVVIAKLLLTNARVLLLYDLTRGVDVGTKGEIFALMRDLVRRGYGLLFFSTDTQELVNVADRIAVMSAGRVVATLEGERSTEDDVVRASIGEAVAA